MDWRSAPAPLGAIRYNPGMGEPVFDGHQILERIESGPVADVYRALRLSLGRPVLIKALSPSILPSSPFAALLEREARLLAELDHPALPRVYDFVKTPDAMWLVLEEARGQRLAELLQDGHTLPPLVAAAIALEVARGLGHAHDHQIVHRAVSPSHVTVLRDGRVKLIDLAMAATDTSLPDGPELLDTNPGDDLEYRSPEQILGEAPDPRSDLFSLGATLYRALAGQGPFASTEHTGGAAGRIRKEAPSPLSRVASGLPASLDRVVQRCLQKLPGDRFASAHELVHALELVLLEAKLDPHATGELIAGALLDLSSADSDAPTPERRSRTLPQLQLPGGLPALIGLVACSALIFVGGAVIQAAFEESHGQGHGRTAGALPLAPSEPGHLRVVAEPWAHVFIDGEHVETTPFAQPIPLDPGTHYIRLEHPAAPPMRREIDIIRGEVVFLDIKLDVPLSEVPMPLPSASAGAEDAGADAASDAAGPSP